jgi:hypothetical protein
LGHMDHSIRNDVCSVLIRMVEAIYNSNHYLDSNSVHHTIAMGQSKQIERRIYLPLFSQSIK